MSNMIKHIFKFYYDGFKHMPSWGKKMWIIILIKLFIMFAILKLFFFDNYLNSKFENNRDKGEYVLEQLIKPSK